MSRSFSHLLHMRISSNLMVTSDFVLTLSLNSFDSCACIAENPSAHSAMMLSVKECEILPALHALVDLAVRDLP